MTSAEGAQKLPEAPLKVDAPERCPPGSGTDQDLTIDQRDSEPFDGTPCGNPMVGVYGRSEISTLVEGTEGHLLAVALDGLTLAREVGGWDSGDDVLREVAARFQDRLGNDDVLVCMTGDRFMVFTPEVKARSVASLADGLLAALELPFAVRGQQVFVSAVLGIAPINADHDHRDVLHRASSALMRAQATRRPIEWYDVEFHQSLMDRRRLANELRQALEEDRLLLLYQPIYDLRSGRYVGAEALIRWEHPQYGLIRPEAFLPTAGQKGLDRLIGTWVLSSGLGQLARWRADRRLEVRRAAPSTLWVNVSGGDVAAPQMADRILAQLQQAGIEPSRLGIEIPHSVFADDSPLLLGQLSHLREVGVQIAIDDFGRGKGSLEALCRLPADVLKVDVSFVHKVTSRRGRGMVRAMIDIARNMDLAVVAEGVESPEQLVALRELGCDMAAGFLLARPVPHTELAQSVADGQVLLHPDNPHKRPWWRRGRARTDTAENRPVQPDLLPDQRDPVTGLGNHRAAIETVRQHMDADRLPVLLLIELDGFSATNLMWGTEATDAVLRAEARKLHAITGAWAFRVEEGRFALCLPDSRRGHLSSQVDLVDLAKGPKGLTACVGVAHARPRSTPKELEERARQALNAAQRRGHGSVVDHLTGRTAAPTPSPAQARALYTVLRTGYLRVHYQPIISLQSDVVVGYQALARPQHDHGLAGPIEAFQVAEALDLVPELDAVCRSSIFFDSPGFDLPAHTRLFITIAPQALGHRSLGSGHLIQEVRSAGLDPARVVWQLRESPAVPAAIFDQEARRLKECGFGIALDDAGGGTSGLRALAAVPFDVVKLAPALLAKAHLDESSAALMEALAIFCLRGNSEIMATGVETEEQLANARNLRTAPNGTPWIGSAQGDVLGKPRPQLRADG